MTQAEGPLTIDELRSLVAAGKVDTVVIAITDMQGRLQGKRCGAKYFLDVVVPHAAEACNYLLAVDVDMNTVGGYAMSSWESGYGDFVFGRIWTPSAHAVARGHRAGAVRPGVGRRSRVASPRQLLRRQLDRLAERGLVRLRGHRAGVHLSSTTATRLPGTRATAGLDPPTSTTSTTRSSAPAGLSACCGASAMA